MPASIINTCCFGKFGPLHLASLEQLHTFAKANTFRYGFMVAEQYDEISKSEPAVAIQIYWQEILLMSHMAAMTSLLRSRAWLLGSCRAIEDDNFLAFSGCFRGFLEAASDTFDALEAVPLALIENREHILKYLLRRPSAVIVIDGLEDKLIHFLVARELRKGEVVPSSHAAKKAADYFSSVEATRQGPIRELYRRLCDYAHPSKASVDLFIETQATGHQLLRPAGQQQHAMALLSEHRDALETAFFCGLNVPFLTLKVLNEFPIEALHTPFLSSFRFDAIPVGEHIRKLLGEDRW